MTRFIEINSWDALVTFLQSLPPVDIASRGQQREYLDMKSKLDRCLTSPILDSRLGMERAICQRFREHAPIYLSDVERRYLETRWLQLVLMQHYGAPTRLLDWSKSIWVATFFAVFGSWDSDGYVYGFSRNKLEKCIRELFPSELRDLVWGPHSNEGFFNKDWDWAIGNDLLFKSQAAENLSSWVATFYSREGHFPRLIAQQGFFTFASKPNLDHWDFISAVVGDDSFVLKIKAAEKPEILRRLNSIGLNGATLFPGPDGIGRSLEGFARAWGLDPDHRSSG